MSFVVAVTHDTAVVAFCCFYFWVLLSSFSYCGCCFLLDLCLVEVAVIVPLVAAPLGHGF